MTANFIAPSPPDRVLLVEGQDDKHLVWQICRREPSLFSVYRTGHQMWVTLLQPPTTFLISEKGNRSELLKSIRQEMVVRDRKAVGIIVDADSSTATSWADVWREIANIGVQQPGSLNPSGTIVPATSHHPSVGVWLMPDNQVSGELEDFAVRMVPSNNQVWPLSSNYIRQIPTQHQKFNAAKVDKAILYAWLAALREPGRVGAAVGAGELDVSGQLCKGFVSLAYPVVQLVTLGVHRCPSDSGVSRPETDWKVGSDTRFGSPS